MQQNQELKRTEEANIFGVNCAITVDQVNDYKKHLERSVIFTWINLIWLICGLGIFIVLVSVGGANAAPQKDGGYTLSDYAKGLLIASAVVICVTFAVGVLIGIFNVKEAIKTNKPYSRPLFMILSMMAFSGLFFTAGFASWVLYIIYLIEAYEKLGIVKKYLNKEK